MSKSDSSPTSGATSSGAAAAQTPRKSLSSAAQRALAEAAERRAQRDKHATERPAEVNGPAGPDPVRYGDWEKKGIASDF